MKLSHARASLAVLAALVWARAAHAGSFAEDGTYVFDPAATSTLDFEDVDPGTGGAGGAGSTSSSGTGGGAPTADPALHGVHALELEAFVGVDFPVDVLAEARTYRVSAWIWGAETNADVEITYPGSASVDELAALYPTGRMTSDGWVEMANDHIRVEGQRAPKVTVGFFSPTRARVDAVEVVPDGDIAPNTTNRACDGMKDVGACGPEQICRFSVCRNMGGSVPPIPTDRDDVADYLANRIRFLFGPNLERTLDFPVVEDALTQMKGATDRWLYWNGLMLAIRRLHDGHTSTGSIADFVLQNKKPITACFIEGDADLSHALAPKDPGYLDVLVSHVGADHNLGLKPGDRLVAVDGQHPIAWARSLVDVVWGISPVSNHRTFAELAEQLRGLVARYAHDITVVRCDAATSTCAAPETIVIADLPALAEGEAVQSTSCDNRPLRHLPTSPADHASGSSTVYGGIVNDSNPTEAIYGIEWESLYTTTGSDGSGAALQQNVNLWKASAKGVILDHRSGNGGTLAADQILWNLNVPAKKIDAYFDRQFAEQTPFTEEEGLALFNAAAGVGLADTAGTTGPITTLPMALLITRDVSASDWLPLGYKGAPGVRIFGPFETNGGFSTRYSFGYWLGMNYVMAVGDSIDPQGKTLNGTGVSPDEIVLPKQSDLLAGKDTVYEAALAWVRSQL
ncbi:MAG: S41 family peptidase [Polyangiaceae bacterium]